MGSGAETAGETAKYMNEHGEKVGVLAVHLFRPFSVEHFIQALPSTVKSIAVLDRTKEPGGAGEPLYQDVLTALAEAWDAQNPGCDRRSLWSVFERIHAGDGQRLSMMSC